MDIVICVSLKDCYFLNKNLYFIEKNLNPDHIWILTDRRNFRYLPQNNSLITCIEENELLNNLTFSRVKKVINKYLSTRAYGWYYQQFLKLGFALSKYAQNEYLVWDSDTVPLSPIVFKDENGCDFILSKKEYNIPYFNTIDHLFKVEKKADYSFIAEHMVFNVAIVKEMLAKIEMNSKNNLDWIEQCIASIQDDVTHAFSEFETYGTYCLNYHPKQLVVRSFNTFRYGSLIYGVIANRKEIENLSFDLTTISFEMSDYPVSLHRRVIQFLLYWFFRLIVKCRIEIKRFPF